MGRKSSASLSILPVQPISRIQPPDGLSEAELSLWRAVVDSKPGDWFGEDSAPLLTEYVRAIAMCDDLDGKIKLGLNGGIEVELVGKVIEGFMKLRDMEAKRAVSIATKLRLTQQSRYTPQAAATASKKAGNARPWESR